MNHKLKNLSGHCKKIIKEKTDLHINKKIVPNEMHAYNTGILLIMSQKKNVHKIS